MRERVIVTLGMLVAACGGSQPKISEDERDLATERGHYQRAADDAIAAFSGNRMESGEVSFGLLLRTCGRADRRNFKFCADLEAQVQAAEDAMWQRRAGSSNDPVLARCRGRQHRRMKLDRECEKVIADNEHKSRVDSFAYILETLDRELDSAKNDTVRARRCASLGDDVYHDETTDPRVPALRQKVGDRCKAALASAEEHCAAQVTSPLEANDARGAYSMMSKEFCSRVTYRRVVSALLTDFERKENCADKRYSDEIDASKLDAATSAKLGRYQQRIASLCSPVAGRGSSGPPAMLGPQPTWSPSQTTAPTRRGDCDTFSSSGQKGTIYQTGCR